MAPIRLDPRNWRELLALARTVERNASQAIGMMTLPGWPAESSATILAAASSPGVLALASGEAGATFVAAGGTGLAPRRTTGTRPTWDNSAFDRSSGSKQGRPSQCLPISQPSGSRLPLPSSIERPARPETCHENLNLFRTAMANLSLVRKAMGAGGKTSKGPRENNFAICGAGVTPAGTGNAGGTPAPQR